MPGGGKQLGEQLRAVIVDAASALWLEVGWSAFTMARLAERVGVSRQTLYNEVGSKANLAVLLRGQSDQRILAFIDDAFAAIPIDGDVDVRAEVVNAVGRAAFSLLHALRTDPMVPAIVETDRGMASDLLASVPGGVENLRGQVRQRFRANLEHLALGLSERQLADFVDVVVRLVLSEASQPSGPRVEAIATIMWVARRLLQVPD
jgi:AcrR family transcriptional regulator